MSSMKPKTAALALSAALAVSMSGCVTAPSPSEYRAPQPAKAVELEQLWSGRWLEVARLPEWERESAEVWVCGPVKFMQAQWLALLDAGVPPARLHREVFGPELLDHLL